MYVKGETSVSTALLGHEKFENGPKMCMSMFCKDGDLKQCRFESKAQMRDTISSFRAKQGIVSDVSITSNSYTKKSICLYHACCLIIYIIVYKDQKRNLQIFHKIGIFQISTEYS